MLRLILLAAIALAIVPAARAAESYDNCQGTVASLPATIGSPGVWCLKSDLATGMTSGNAITVTANNVTLDCNGFRLGGLSAGAGTMASGIVAVDRSNVTVRNCNVRGFLNGIYLSGAGHLVEDNRLDSNTRVGAYVEADGFMVRRNLITQTGLGTVYSDVYGIAATGTAGVIEDNLISNVVGNTSAFAWASGAGIVISAAYSVLRGNDITGVFVGSDSTAVGIQSNGAKNKLIENTVSQLSSPTGSRRGVSCTGDATGVAVRNTISDMSSAPYAVWACGDGGGNVSH